MYAVILNGPPGSGKDTLSAELVSEFQQLGFNDSLYAVSFDWLRDLNSACIVHEGYKDIRNYYEDFVRACKGRNSKELDFIDIGIPFHVEGNILDEGKTIWSPRMLLQHVSENVYKPKYGNGCFGHYALQSLDNTDIRPIMFSDGGFVDEINVVSEAMPTLVIHLKRDGYGFEGDSRSYVSNSQALQVLELEVIDGEVEGTVRRLEELVCSFIANNEEVLGRYCIERLLRVLD